MTDRLPWLPGSGQLAGMKFDCCRLEKKSGGHSDLENVYEKTTCQFPIKFTAEDYL
jgi:hypothetical protein